MTSPASINQSVATNQNTAGLARKVNASPITVGHNGQYLIFQFHQNGKPIATHVYQTSEPDAFRGLTPSNPDHIHDYGLILVGLLNRQSAKGIKPGTPEYDRVLASIFAQDVPQVPYQ